MKKTQENFLHKKAILFEKTDKARTTLICWQNENNEIEEIIAYYTLANKALNVSSLSKNKQKEIRGGAPLNSKDVEVPSFLIGQIGRNDNTKSPLESNALFKEIFSTLRKANKIIGTRIAYLECKDHPKLREIYENKGFKLLETSDGTLYKNNDLIVYIITLKKIKETLKNNKWI